MKFSANRVDFTKAVAACARIVEKKSNIPILSHMALVADEKSVTIRSTDLDMEMTARFAADVKEQGSATLLAEMLDGFLSRVKSETISLDMDEPFKAVIKSAKSRLTIPTLDVTDLPTIQGADPTCEFDFHADHLKSALNQCIFTIIDDVKSHFIPGTYVHLSRENEAPALRFAAAGGPGFMLSERDLPEAARALGEGFIIPKPTAAEIIKLGSGDCRISVSDGYAKFAFYGGLTIATRLIVHRFPDYRRVFVETFDRGAAIETKPLIEALDRVMLASDGKDLCVRVTFGDGVATLDKRSQTHGEASEEIIAECDPHATFGINAKFFIAALESINADVVEIFCNDPSKPLMIRPRGLKTPTCMIAPMMIAG